MEFSPEEDPWFYRLFLLASVALFIVPAWAGPFGAVLTDVLNSPAVARWTSGWTRLDRWLVEPQVRLLELVSPPLAERWPVAGGLSDAHRIMYSVFYGILGWISVRLVCHQYLLGWLRVGWLLIYWAVCVAFLQVVALIMLHFGVLRG